MWRVIELSLEAAISSDFLVYVIWDDMTVKSTDDSLFGPYQTSPIQITNRGGVKSSMAAENEYPLSSKSPSVAASTADACNLRALSKQTHQVFTG